MNDLVIPDTTRERVNQTYRKHLDALFDLEYYRARHRDTLKVAQHYDFVIGLGTAFSGGSGLGILADPRFALLCGFVTSGAVILSVGKSAYGWSEKVKASMERVGAYSKLSASYTQLVEDIRAKKEWNEEFEQWFKRLNEEKANIPPYPFDHWKTNKLRGLQQEIKRRVPYETWWGFTR